MNNPNPDTIRAILRDFGFGAERVDRAMVALLNDHAAVLAALEPMITPKALCERLDISSTTLWRLQPPCHIVGARKRYILSEVVAFLKQRGSVRSDGGTQE